MNLGFIGPGMCCCAAVCLIPVSLVRPGSSGHTSAEDESLWMQANWPCVIICFLSPVPLDKDKALFWPDVL